MSLHTFPVTDLDQDIHQSDFDVTAKNDINLKGSEGWKVSQKTMTGGVSAGVDLVEIDNGKLRMTILPTRGMGLWKGEYEGLRLGWDSPVEHPVHPSLIYPLAFSGIGWLKGFNELLCRCGLSWHGAPGIDSMQDNNGNIIETDLTLHGQIANTPAHRVTLEVDEDGQGILAVTGEVDETMLFGPRLRLKTRMETEAGSNWFRITDEIINIGGKETESELLYHTNFGTPFLEKGSKVVAPVSEVAPCNDHSAKDMKTWTEYQGPESGYVEQCHFFEMIADDQDSTIVMLKNASGNHAVSLTYSKTELPSFTVWKNTQAIEDGYVTGLEPGTSLPNNRSFERSQGRIRTLKPGESYQTGFTLRVHSTVGEVQEIEEKISQLQAGITPVLHENPVSKWTPGLE